MAMPSITWHCVCPLVTCKRHERKAFIADSWGALMGQISHHARDCHEEENKYGFWSPEHVKFVRENFGEYDHVRDCTVAKRADLPAGSAERGRGRASPRRARSPPRYGKSPHRPRSPPMDMEDALCLYWQDIDAAKARLLSRMGRLNEGR